jgi:Cdc6-like AAA superfamily ATPase
MPKKQASGLMTSFQDSPTDVSDKAYRAGVFHLESLRLRREKVQQSALQVSIPWNTSLTTTNAQNLDSFSDDLNKQIKLAMERYIDTMHGTGATIAQSTEVARQAIESINLDQDSESKFHAVMMDLAEFCSVHLAKSCKYSYRQLID